MGKRSSVRKRQKIGKGGEGEREREKEGRQKMISLLCSVP
jgi:hypothetical protein